MGNAVRSGRPGLLCVLLLSFAAAAAHAAEESSLSGGAAELVRTWFDRTAVRGRFPSPRGGIPIEYAVLPAREEKGALVVLAGEGAGFLQLRELAYDLRDSGWSLYMMDLRGQGLSGRLLPDPGKSYVHDYRDWLADLYAFHRGVVSATPHARVVIMGHSVGGTLAALFAEENPSLLSGVVLASPMFRFPASLPEPLAYVLLRLEILFGREKDLPPWKTPDTPPWTAVPASGAASGTASGFEGNPFTTSAARYALLASDAAPFSHPAAGRATVRLLKEIRDLGTRVLRRAGRITAPVLILEAEEDGLARRDMMEEARRRIRTCRSVVFPRARHGLLWERDEVRGAVLGELGAFLGGRPRY